MKKLFTLIAILVLFSAVSAPLALANEENSSSEEKAVVTLLVKSVDRKLINELFLNEMQYVKLRNLSKQYQKDVAALSSTSLIEETPQKVSLQQLNHQYFTEIAAILTTHQLSIFTQQNTVALAN